MSRLARTSALLLPLGLAATAAAAEGKGEIYWKSQFWTVYEYKETANCVAGAMYGNVFFAFVLRKNAPISITVVNRAWAIPKGQYEGSIQFDSEPPQAVYATAEGTAVNIAFTFNEQIVKDIVFGKRLQITAGSFSQSFTLLDTQYALPKLVECADRSGSAKSNPFAGQPNPFADQKPKSRPGNPKLLYQ